MVSEDVVRRELEGTVRAHLREWETYITSSLDMDYQGTVLLTLYFNDPSIPRSRTLDEFILLRGLTEPEARSYIHCAAHSLCFRALRSWGLFEMKVSENV